MKISLSVNILSQDQMSSVWETLKPKKFKKFGTVLAKVATKQTKVVTKLDGKVETTNVAQVGDVIITNPLGEMYVLKQDKFLQRYTGNKLSESNQEFDAKGFCFASIYTGEDLEFLASWGEKMILNSGDYLCSTTKEAKGDLYRIEKNAFKETYKPA